MSMTAGARLSPPRRVADFLKLPMTVLVADDDSGVRKLASRILRTSGYAVLEAASGTEALVVARAWHGRIHLLVTDVAMPETSGWDLARRLQDERPGLE